MAILTSSLPFLFWLSLAFSAFGQQPGPTTGLTPITTEAAIGKGYLPLCMPGTVNNIAEKHHTDGAYIFGEGSFAFAPSDFPNLARPLMPDGSAHMWSLNVDQNPSTEVAIKLEDAGYFFYRKQDVNGSWIIAADPAAGDGRFWFKRWTVSPDLPLFSNGDYTRSFVFTTPLCVRAFFQLWHRGKMQKETGWNSFSFFGAVRRIDFEFIEDNESLVPVASDYPPQVRDYAVIVRFYEKPDSKSFIYEAREIIPEELHTAAVVGGTNGPFHRDLEDRPLQPEELLGKDIPIYKDFDVAKDNTQTLASQLVLRFTKSPPEPEFQNALKQTKSTSSSNK